MKFRESTPKEVRDVLVSAYLSHTRIRIHYGHPDGRDWHEENDVTGYVRTSMGPALKIPILLPNTRSTGGGAILDHCIVKVRETKTGRVLYQHPTYDPGKFEIRPLEGKDKEAGYVEGVYINGENHANFRKPGQAARWVKKMGGKIETGGSNVKAV